MWLANSVPVIDAQSTGMKRCAARGTQRMDRSGDQLLSCAAGPGDDDAGRIRSYGPNRGTHFLNPIGDTDHPVQGRRFAIRVTLHFGHLPARFAMVPLPRQPHQSEVIRSSDATLPRIAFLLLAETAPAE